MTSSSKTNTVDDIVFNAVLQFVNDGKSTEWIGTMTQLNSSLKKILGKTNATFLPKSPSALRVVLNRLVNKIRKRKISVKFARDTDYNRTRYVRFAR